MTYRIDSDIFWSYGKVFDINTNEVVGPGPNPAWKTFDVNFFGKTWIKMLFLSFATFRKKEYICR